MVDISGKDVVEHVVDERVGPLLALLATKVVHGVKYDAHEALNGDVAGLVGLKPFGIYARCLHESCSEPLDAFHPFEETRHKLSFWASLHREDWPGFVKTHCYVFY